MGFTKTFLSRKGLVMTARFKRKAKKWRGRTSHGHGAKKKARGGGSHGGRGFAGLHKHKYSSVVTHTIDYEFGYKGFHSLKKREKAINVGDLWRVSSETNIDLTKLGYGKLLSRGSVSKPVAISVHAASPRAIEKIKKAGGSVTGLKPKIEKPAQKTQQPKPAQKK